MENEKQANQVKSKLKQLNLMLEGLHWVRALCLLGVVFLLFTTLIARPIYVRGDSMYPALKDGELGVTNILDKNIKPLKRFDVVVVYNQEEDRNLVKRIIGLPGEMIAYRDDVLYVNEEVVDETFFDSDYKNEQTRDGAINFTEDFGPVVLKENEYFLCGDNRRVSKDSRALGPFKESDILSKGAFIVFK